MNEFADIIHEIGLALTDLGIELSETSRQIKYIPISEEDKLALLAVLRPMATNMVTMNEKLRTYINHRDLR